MVARAIAPSRARRAGAHPIRPETVNSHRIEQERTGLDTAAAPRTSCHWSTADGSALFVASSRCQPGTELSIGDCGEGASSPKTALSPSECKVGRMRVTSPRQPAPAATQKGQRIRARTPAGRGVAGEGLKLRECGAHLVGFISLHLAVVAHLV